MGKIRKHKERKKPLVLRKPVVHFDVDDTLVYWDVTIVPGEKLNVFKIGDHPYLANMEHRSLLIEHAKRGHHVVVWSKGGADWAETVVEALGLEEYVDVIQDKPHWIYDDMPVSAWMPKSQYAGIRPEDL